MTDNTELPTAREAAEALASVERMRSAGLKRGRFPRGFAVAAALWTGALTTTVGLASPTSIPLLVLGLLGYWLWCRKTGVWIWFIRLWLSQRKQVSQGSRELRAAILVSILVGGVMMAGYVGGQSFGLAWAPFVAGAIVAVVTFVLAEIASPPVHQGLSEGQRS